MVTYLKDQIIKLVWVVALVVILEMTLGIIDVESLKGRGIGTYGLKFLDRTHTQ